MQQQGVVHMRYSSLLFFILLWVVTTNASFFRSGCFDQQSWCSKVKGFCKDHAVIAPICPKSCQKCTPTEKRCPPHNKCEHSCQVVDHKIQCGCNEGYKLMRDKRTCRDVNECLTERPCTDLKAPVCVNTVGSYRCEGVSQKCSGDFTEYYNSTECCRLSDGSCGKNSENGGINVGGFDSLLARWPWISLLTISSNNVCGGILLNEHWVISTARCFGDTKPERIQAHFGVVNTKDLRSEKQHQRREVESIIKHPNYKYPDYDVSLLRLKKDVMINDFVSNLCLPVGEKPKVGSNCWTIDYALSVNRGQVVRMLDQVSVSISENRQCNLTDNKIEDRRRSSVDAICVSDILQDGRSCGGTPGVALVCQRCSSCEWYIAGLASKIPGCHGKTRYTIFADVATHETWIESIIGIKTSKAQESVKCNDDKGDRGTHSQRQPTNKNPLTDFRPDIKKQPVFWTEWSMWSQCSTSCGQGISERVRTCNGNPSRNQNCIGSNKETRTCKEPLCKEDSEDFGPWSKCSASCKGGLRSRIRLCKEKKGLSGCKGNPRERQRCNTQPCPRFGRWTKYQECSVTCGQGVQKSERECLHGKVGQRGCIGRHSRVRICRKRKCERWSAWGPWSSCSHSCGGGVMTMRRKCLVNVTSCSGSSNKTRNCNIRSCQVCSQWSLWSNCSILCGSGNQMRSRNCSGGKTEEQTQVCKGTKCSQWSKWSQWSTCTATCGRSQRSKTRKCENGSSCEGERSIVEHCSNDSCPEKLGWSQWTAWSECSSKCGAGERRRERDCMQSNSVCLGAPFEKLVCNSPCVTRDVCADKVDKSHSCSHSLLWCSFFPSFMVGRCDKTCCLEEYNAAYTQWSEWSECSVTCGQGNQVRSRQCKQTTSCAKFNSHLEETKLCKQKDCFARRLSLCSATCGGGTRKRTICTSPSENCTIIEDCNTVPCSRLTYLTDWTDWSPCSRTCGRGGIRKRTRSCVDTNGKQTRSSLCDGDKQVSEHCSVGACSEGWSEWTMWGNCSVACGIGKIRRSRTCLGINCEGNGVQEETCVASECSIDLTAPCADSPEMSYLCQYLNTYCTNGYMMYACRKSCGLCY